MIAQKNGAVCAASVLRRTTIGAMAALAVLAGALPGSARSEGATDRKSVV